MIYFQDIQFRYEGTISSEIGVKDINLIVHTGECVLLCGRSGCGKTTLTKLINGLLYGNLFAFEYAPKQYCHNRTFEQPDFFDHWIFYRPADCLRIWIYTRANWGRSCIQANPSLFRG